MMLEACAVLVERGDPDRFLATMAAPPAARVCLFPLYAFNLEIARAPLMAKEPMIAEMRLQWWQDVLAEIAEGRAVRGHEVTTPLATALTSETAKGLADLVDARRMDIAPTPWASAEALMAYLDRTAGTLLWTAARLLGETGGEAGIRALGRAQGLANWCLAAPALAATGRSPFPDASADAIGALARRQLDELRSLHLPRNPALLAAWRAPPLLRQAARHPGRVMAGEIAQSEFSRKAGLLWRSFAG